ncbi:MAG: methyltransferase [Bacteroidota bacterium]
MRPFQFKQFTIHQDRCAMKVGTDGILLGAWTSLEKSPDRILDIGTGTGLISLMLAQRSTAETLDAVELDDDAYEQCVRNFENSPWADQLFCFHAGLEEFVEEFREEGSLKTEKYDLIVSNPPFFEPSLKMEEHMKASRKKARFFDSLPFKTLLEGASQLLTVTGSFSVIVPYAEETTFMRLASSFELFPWRRTHVRGIAKSPIRRSLLQFGFQKGKIEKDEIAIEIGPKVYSKEYRELTQDFYLKM